MEAEQKKEKVVELKQTIATSDDECLISGRTEVVIEFGTTD